MSRHLSFAACLLLAVPSLALEESPLVITHHGFLLDSQDQPVTESTEITFALYDDPAVTSAPTPVWSETYSVLISAGRYAVLLGDTLGLNNDRKPLPANLFGPTPLWLGIRIGDGPELSPRLRIASVPYAGRAASAAAIDPDTVGTEQIKDAAVTLAKLDLTDGKFVGLDADTLDGLDSSAFAPAAIESRPRPTSSKGSRTRPPPSRARPISSPPSRRPPTPSRRTPTTSPP